MIKVTLSESYVMDMLSILSVKILKQPTAINISNHKNLEDEIKSQIGWVKYEDIICSEEYLELSRTNLNLFNHIDEIKSRPFKEKDAVETDAYNYSRFLGKKKLQERFFPESPLREQKIGYEQVQA
jgi:hypothetical protein